jgi:hypothetical protein
MRCQRAATRAHIANIRDALLQIGGYDETFGFGEDTDLLLRRGGQYTFEFTVDILTYVMQNPDSVTRRPIDKETMREVLVQRVSIFEK